MASTRRLVAQLLAATLLVGLLTPGEAGNLDHLLSLKPKASPATQADTVRGLLLRLLPKQAHLFEVIVDEALTENHLDKFKVG